MLKLKWFALLCSIPLLMVAGCAKENQPDQALQVDPGSETIALADAIKALDNVMQMTAKTKSALERSFSEENITVIGKNALSVATKSVETDFIPDTLMYLVNFDNNQGFAIMAGDRRLGEDVYCITEYGSLSAGDFSEAFAAISANRHSGADDEECTEAGYRIVPSIILSAMMSDLVYGKREAASDTKATEGNTYGPFLQTKWSQGQDFAQVNLWNKYTPNNYPAGCVAIATAQLMLYNRVPADTYFDGKQCSWTEMEKVCNGKFYHTPYFSGTDEQKDQVAHFVYEIGKRHNCYIRYGEDGSGGWADGAKRTLNNYNYPNVKKFLGFGNKNQRKADDCLRDRLPVYLDGTGGGSGHAWVIDGLMDDAYYHINWGWLGACDGYYKKGVFNTTDRYSYDINIDTGATTSEHRNYTWNYRLITYTR